MKKVFQLHFILSPLHSFFFIRSLLLHPFFFSYFFSALRYAHAWFAFLTSFFSLPSYPFTGKLCGRTGFLGHKVLLGT